MARNESGRAPNGGRSPEQMTPLQKQYYEIKNEYPECLLFFRLGDFYELFDEDARVASRELDLTLTTRDRTKPPEEQMPMCGVPYHSADSYISRLIKRGFKVAVCEQQEDPATAKGLVKRGVIRVITPGTVTDETMLESGRANYLAAVCVLRDGAACAFCDAASGKFSAVEFDKRGVAHVISELGSFGPSEVILSEEAADSAELTMFLTMRLGAAVEQRGGDYFDGGDAAGRVLAQFKAGSLAELGLDSRPLALAAAGALLRYLYETQMCECGHINRLELLDEGLYMELDWSARRSLELTANIRTGEKRGSLLAVLDYTRTPMGARLLRSWVEMPLVSVRDIRARLAAVSELYSDNVLRRELMSALEGMGDMPRLISRVAYQTANGRDMLALGEACSRLPRLRELLSGTKCALLAPARDMDALEDVRKDIAFTVCDDPPVSIRDGGVLRRGFSEEVERLRAVHENAASLVAELERREQERSGIKKLRVAYNRLTGYAIEIPNSADVSKLPPDYVRKQTLKNCERYITTELKELEAEINSAQTRVCQLEYDYFCRLRASVAERMGRIQRSADTTAELDALCSLAEAAVRRGYTCPEVDDGGGIEIIDGRHPVVEAAQRDTRFVPNDTHMNRTTDRLAIITGPNMAGKSTYMRQTALIVLMAQMGSFVPAKSAVIGLVDRVFTRIGASDDLSGGRSTFMVEMSEVAHILRTATPRSLILLDEIGRGTSTYDGMAIARAVAEYCADKRRLGAKTLLATHYHELTDLEGKLDGVRNYYIAARKSGERVIFLRKIVPGAADDSYGIEVAALAEVPRSVVERARECLDELNAAARSAPAAPAPAAEEGQLTLGSAAGEEVLDALRRARLDTLSPIEAMNLLYELQRKLTP